MENDFLSFRVKREIFPREQFEKIRFLPAVEMTEMVIEMTEKVVEMTGPIFYEINNR